jgi:RPA family protein
MTRNRTGRIFSRDLRIPADSYIARDQDNEHRLPDEIIQKIILISRIMLIFIRL